MSQGQRRLAAIMFTDMVGYTALGQRDESLSLALVDEQRKLVRPVLDRNHGREVKTMGDAFFVEFPSALDAIRAAYEIQRAVREFNVPFPDERRVHLRVGVHLGDVVESAGDISGDAVNVASRIEALAEDGGVCVTRQVYDHVQGKFELPFSPLGPKALKNVSFAVDVFKMVMPWEKEIRAQPHESNPRRIAVLPFANMSPDPGDEYFADGMTEELITSLSGLSELTVIARTSVMKYKDASKGASEIAKELSAGTLVEGSVRKAANRVRITVQLIDAKNEAHLWAQNYDRQLDDIFAIQSDVARQVAGALQVRLLNSERKKLEKSPTSNIEAYTLYLKGNYYFNKAFGTREALERAIAHLEEAVSNDPNFALAYAKLAMCHNQLGFFGLASSKESGRKAREYVTKALALDDNLAEVHDVNARVLRNYDWDFIGSEREYDRAIQLNPNLAEAVGSRALLKAFNRRFDEAVAEVTRALELDPLGPQAGGYFATVNLYSGRTQVAMDHFERLLRDDPTSTYNRGNLGLARVRAGSTEAGLGLVKEAASLKNASSQSDLAYVLAQAGKNDELKTLLATLLESVKSNHELMVAVGSAYANLRDADNAMEWLAKAYDEHLPYLVTANSDFVFDSIRSDPRFQALMKKMGWTNT